MKNNKGFTLIELSISILVVVLFSTIVANINYAIYTNTVDAKRTAIATEKAVEILEYIDSIDITDGFDDDGNMVDENGIVVNYIRDKYYNAEFRTNNIIGFTIDNKYDCVVIFEDYADLEKDTEENIEKNIVKIVTVQITYNVGKNTDNVTIQRVITQK